MDHAPHGAAAADQGHVDHELAVAAHELARAVQRIHQKVVRRARGRVAVRVLFRNQGRAWKGPVQLAQQQVVAGHVGLGHGRIVGLDAHREAAPVHGHDLAPGDLCDLGRRKGGIERGGGRHLGGGAGGGTTAHGRQAESSRSQISSSLGSPSL
jgi:hypothetical protein